MSVATGGILGQSDRAARDLAVPRAELSVADLRGYYEDNGSRFRCVPEFDPREAVRVRHVFRLLPRDAGSSALDVGCGDGYLCEQLARRGFDTIVGIDLANSRLAYAQGRNPHGRFAQSDVNRLPFADASFDVVTCVDVLEHQPDPVGALRELARVARRYVVVKTPYRESVAENMCPHCSRTFPPDGHLHRFDEHRFAALAEAAGLRLRRWRHGHPMFEYRRFRYLPPLRWLIAGYYRDSGFIGGLFEKDWRSE
ncbi:MAG: class I SAM-dependent methyltransferase [Phycisphaerae bacterium]|nr:class I SAM-dependent methyltransferase [Phycisphaerae bacterium]